MGRIRCAVRVWVGKCEGKRDGLGLVFRVWLLGLMFWALGVLFGFYWVKNRRASGRFKVIGLRVSLIR